jgi:hypothetical protein
MGLLITFSRKYGNIWELLYVAMMAAPALARGRAVASAPLAGPGGLKWLPCSACARPQRQASLV